MKTFVGLLLFLLKLSNSSVTAKWHFQASLSCSRCQIGGMQPFNLNGEIKGGSTIPDGYEFFKDIGYYKFYPIGTTSFNEALSICKKDDAHLAIINSQAEEEVLKKIYAKYPDAKELAYLGFNDIEEEGKYVTIFGKPLSDTGFIKWHTGEPNSAGGNEDCGSMHRNGGLNDLWCDENGPWPFFCEYEIERPYCHSK